jgi:4-amino-4-deoxy-L-arabinose transferase-like glycosyltransferase
MELLKNSLVVLPFLAFAGCWTALWRRGQDWRSSFVVSATLWGVWVAITTELLSAGSLLTRGAVAAVWLAASILAWSCAFSGATDQQLSRGSESPEPEPIEESSEPLALADRLLLAGLGVIVLLLAIVAFVAPPNTWDAMQYTMPRVIMWIENHGVHFYPTLDYAQLTMSPWTDYAMTHLTLLQGSDRLVNLVEWFAFLGSIIGVSLIARELACGPRGQVLAAVLCGTIPQGILAATSAKPDVGVGFWIVASCFFLLRCKSACTWPNILLTGAGIGLAIMSKGTAFTLLPAVCLAAFFIWPWASRKTFMLRLPAIVVIILALNGAQFYRNIRLSGSPIGFSSPDGEADKKGARHFANGKFGVRDVAGAVLRSTALHFGTPSDRINSSTERIFRRLIRALGVDPDDQAMIEQGNAGKIHSFEVPALAQSEVFAGNMLHSVLFLFSAAILVFLRRPGQRDSTLLAIGVIGAFVLFCAAVRWQPYNARFHLPVFMLGCAVISAALAPRLPRWTLLIVAALAILMAMPYTISNEMRPLFGIQYFHGLRPDHSPNIFTTSRDRLYFQDRHLYVADSFSDAARVVAASGCNDIGLDAFVLHYDYPMLALLRAGLGGPVVRYVGVQNRSAVYARTSAPAPCGVVCLGCALIGQKWKDYGGPGILAFQFDRTVVFLREPVDAVQRIDAANGVDWKPVEADSAVSNAFGGADPPHVSGDLCSAIPDAAVQDVLGSSVSHKSEGIGCRYTAAAGEMEIAAFPIGSYYSKDYADLTAESMGSVQVREPGYFITVVLDRDNPAIAYLHKGKTTYSLNIDRENPQPTSDQYLRLGALLSAGLPASPNMPAN